MFQENFEKEALSYNDKLKKYFEWEDTFIATIKTTHLPLIIFFSVIPIIPFLAKAVALQVFAVDVSFISWWLIFVISSVFFQIILVFISRGWPKGIDPEKSLSVYAYLIHNHLKNHSHTSDKDILSEAQSINLRFIPAWKKSYLVDGQLKVLEALDSDLGGVFKLHGITCRLDSFDSLQKIQNNIPLFQLDTDSDVYFSTLKQIESRLLLNLKAGLYFSEFVEGFRYLSKLLYLLRASNNSSQELKEVFTELAKVVSKLPDYKPEKKESNGVISGIKNLCVFLIGITFTSPYKPVRFFLWFFTLGMVSLFGLLELFSKILETDYKPHVVPILAICGSLSIGGAVYLSKKGE